MIFPWVEEARLTIVERIAHVLRPRLPFETRFGPVVETPDDLELGEILHLAHGRLNTLTASVIEQLRDLRHRLAHRMPVDPGKFRTARLTYGRWSES